MKTAYIFKRTAIALLCSVLCLMAAAQSALTVGELTAAAGKVASVPVYMTNNTDVVAVQFNIQLPFAMSSDAATLSDTRSNGHTIRLNKVSGNKYTVVIMSLENKAIKGNSGILARIPMTVPDNAQADDKYDIVISDVVMSDRNGRNVATEKTGTGVFTVLRTPTPDLVVENLAFANSGNLKPGGKLLLSYDVKNQGTAETGQGWKENIYVENTAGVRSFIGSKSYGNKLLENTAIQRVAELDIPQVVKLEGTVKAVVELVNLTNTGELIADQGNNTAISAGTAVMEKRIFLNYSRVEIEEGNRVRVTLTRSGDWSMEETFDIEEYNDNASKMLTVPATVTIPKGSSAVNFYVSVPDNSEVNPGYRTNLRVTNDEYDEVTMVVDVRDNDKYTLGLTTDKVTYTEGEDVVLTVSTTQVLEEDLRVDISNTATLRFSPSVRVITIPAGQTSASATTTITDNATADPDINVEFTASSNGYVTVKKGVWVNDNDRPNLTIKLVPDVISESDGYYATTAIITRDGSTAGGVSVFVTSTSGELYFDSNKNRIPEGVSSIEIPVSVKDNSMKDGDRVAEVTAAVILSDNRTVVEPGSPSYAKATLTITDNETENILTMVSNVAQLVEGGSGQKVTLKRNNIARALTVSLSCDDSQVEIPSTVSFANGSQTTTFTVKAKSNTTADDGHYAVVKASASDYQSSSFTFYISDHTLCDAYLAEPVEVAGEVYCGQKVRVGVKVNNRGTATLPADYPIEVLLMESRTYVSTAYHTTPTQLLTEGKTTESVEPGETKTFYYDVPVPTDKLLGQYYLFAWINRYMKKDELSMGKDNYSPSAPLYIRPAFTTKNISADKTDYMDGDVMTVSGQMDNSASMLEMSGRNVEVYAVDGSGRRFTKTVSLDGSGNFTASFDINSNYSGNMKVGACCTGEDLVEEQTMVHVWKLALKADYTNLVLTEGVKKTGEVTVTNASAKTLRNISLIHEGMPEGWLITSSTKSSLSAGATTVLTYSILPTSNTKAVDNFTLKVQGTAEGDATVTGERSVQYYSYAAKCKLSPNKEKVNTTLMRGTQRTVEIEVTNVGTDVSGEIAVMCPTETSWLSVASATTVPSIDKKGTMTVSLQLTHQTDMITDGKYKSYVSLKPENGTTLVVPVEITVVGTEQATLTVDVVDVYTLGTDEGEGPHVKDATVRLTNAMTGEVAMTGTTGEDGTWTTDLLKEGTYYVKVTAANHNYAEKTISIGPGETKEMEVFLPYKAVNVTYTVEETTVVDEYRTVVEMTFVPDIPQAIVVPKLPDKWGCGTNVYSIKLENKGRLTAYNPYFEFPNIDGYKFTVKSDYPEVIYPGESANVTIEYVGPEDLDETGIGGLVMNYGYKLKGEMYRSKETYALVVGCEDSMPIIYPSGGLGNGETKNYGGADIPDLKITNEKDDAAGSVNMPNVVYRDYTQTNHNSVTLQFEQRFFLTRQAFKGTLTVDNAQMTNLQDIQVNAKVTTVDGKDVTEMFALEYKGQGNWLNTNDGKVNSGNGFWALEGNQTGIANVLYVPSKETAPTEPVDYYFGGTMTYRDVNTGNLITVELMKTKLTVNPSPDLHLTYFIQRDFISDDPLTEEVEPWEPAQFALLIQNKGAGAALNLKIETTEPQIVENLNNLPVKFTSLYTTIDGKPGTSPFKKLDLGRIEAGQNVMARWWFYSNVSGYVADYNVTMVKSSNYGEDFNLISIDGVKELKHSVTGTVNARSASQASAPARAAELNADTNIFLLNEIVDEENMPDYVIDSNGNGTDDLEIVNDNIECVANGADGEYKLTVNASRSGWVYGEIHDPTNCTMVLSKVVRESDGKDMTSNFWQTDRAMQRDNSILYANVLHMADNIEPGETYILTYSPKPAAAPSVESIDLRGNTVALPQNAVIKAVVKFAEAVDVTSVDKDDVVLHCGNKVIATKVTAENENTFVVEWLADELVSGDYTLTVYTTGVRNVEGLNGKTSKSVEWSQRILDVNTYLRGDSNGDGKVDGLDYTTTAFGVVNDSVEGMLFDNADTNMDGKIDANDLNETSNIAVGSDTDEQSNNNKTKQINDEKVLE